MLKKYYGNELSLDFPNHEAHRTAKQLHNMITTSRMVKTIRQENSSKADILTKPASKINYDTLHHSPLHSNYTNHFRGKKNQKEIGFPKR